MQFVRLMHVYLHAFQVMKINIISSVFLSMMVQSDTKQGLRRVTISLEYFLP